MSEQTIARLKRKDGTLIAEIPLPRTAAEISLAKYVSFLSEMRKFELKSANPIRIMAQAVGEITGVPVADILEAKVGEAWAADKELDGGLRSLYGWCVNALTNYKGQGRTAEDFEFEYKGEKYQIPYIVAAELAGLSDSLPPIDVKQGIEAFEVFRVYEQEVNDVGDPKKERHKRIEQLKTDIVKSGDANGDRARELRRLEMEINLEGDPNGSLLFSRYLRLVAILAPKEGQFLPDSDTKRELEIQARMVHLQEIDTKTALDVDFFLTNLLTRSGRTSNVIGSLSLPLFALAVATRSSSRLKTKRTKKRSRIKGKSKGGLVIVR